MRPRPRPPPGAAGTGSQRWAAFHACGRKWGARCDYDGDWWWPGLLFPVEEGQLCDSTPILSDRAYHKGLIVSHGPESCPTCLSRPLGVTAPFLGGALHTG